jgi:hypothetical protein
VPPLATPVDARILTLVAEAERGRLSVCAGAGLSRGVIPDGVTLARDLDSLLKERMAGYACADPTNLLDVADSAEQPAGGLEALQRLALTVGGFTSAEPQPEHRLLALLVCEGALRLLLTNWDTCVERGWAEEILAIRDAQEALDVSRGGVLKIHGCASRPTSLLITRTQLADEAPIWTQVHFSAAIATSCVVFVGIGDIATYASKRIRELADVVPHADARVVSPNIQAGWDSSEWKDVLPELPDDNKLAMTAYEFADHLARAWALLLLDAVTAGRPADDALADEVGCVLDAYRRMDAEEALSWLRLARWHPEVGESVVQSPEAQAALEALAVLLGRARAAGEPGGIAFFRDPAVSIDSERFEILLTRPNARTADVERAAAERARQAASFSPSGSPVRVLCSAPMLKGPRKSIMDNVEILDPTVPIDGVVDTPVKTPVRLDYADELLMAA